MAACISCGNKAGAFRSECSVCERRRIEANAQEQKDAAQQDWIRRRNEYVAFAWQQITTLLSTNRTPFIYRVTFVQVDTTVNGAEIGDTSFVGLKLMGLDGWEVIGIVPRTMSTALENYVGGNRVWAAGLGGHVVGAYVMVRLAVSRDMIEHQPDLVRTALDEQFLEENPTVPN